VVARSTEGFSPVMVWVNRSFCTIHGYSYVLSATWGVRGSYYSWSLSNSLRGGGRPSCWGRRS
jgi:hypothetical protein